MFYFILGAIAAWGALDIFGKKNQMQKQEEIRGKALCFSTYEDFPIVGMIGVVYKDSSDDMYYTYLNGQYIVITMTDD